MSALAVVIGDVLIDLFYQFVIHLIIIKDHYEFIIKSDFLDFIWICLLTLYDLLCHLLPSIVAFLGFIKLFDGLIFRDYGSSLLIFFILDQRLLLRFDRWIFELVILEFIRDFTNHYLLVRWCLRKWVIRWVWVGLVREWRWVVVVEFSVRSWIHWRWCRGIQDFSKIYIWVFRIILQSILRINLRWVDYWIIVFRDLFNLKCYNFDIF